MSFTLSPKDVEGPIRGKLEDWEDALKSAIEKAIEKEVKKVTNPTDGAGFIKAIGLINGGKDAVSTFAGGTRLATAVAAPEFAVSMAVMGQVGNMLRMDAGNAKRTKLIERDYGAVLDDFMAQVRIAEDTFPSSDRGRELSGRVVDVARNLRFDTEAVRNSWCRRFLENIGAIEVRERVLAKEIEKGLEPIFKKISMLIEESLRSDVGKLPRWLGADPRWKWSGFDVHVPGTHVRSGGAEWPGSVAPGFRRATEDEIRDIMTNLWRYKLTTRSILVGAYGHASTDRIVHCEPIPNPNKALPVPEISPALDQMFLPMRVQSALHLTSQQVRDGVSEAYVDPYQGAGVGPLR